MVRKNVSEPFFLSAELFFGVFVHFSVCNILPIVKIDSMGNAMEVMNFIDPVGNCKESCIRILKKKKPIKVRV